MRLKIYYLLVLNVIIFDGIYAKLLKKNRDSNALEDAYLTTPELIRKYGYPCDIYHLTTDDGYILEIHRVPHGRNGSGETTRIPVIVQHGLLGASSDFILQGPEKSLVYLLADEGYDVWIPNSRGNKYSRNHTTMNPNFNSKFWRFSWHEIGVYDFPTIIDFVLKTTNRSKLFHIGHSQGTTAFYVMAAEKPEYNDKILAHFSYAPSAYEQHIRSTLFIILGQSSFLLGPLAHLIGLNEFLPGDDLLNLVAPPICSEDVGLQEICANVIFTIFGINKKELNYTITSTLLGHLPAGAATDQFLHYGQEVRSGRFCQYDHGFVRNMIKYNSPKPPSYDTSKITAPLYFFYSDGDRTADSRDVERLSNEVANIKQKIKMDDPDWEHLDYAFGISAKEKVYKKTVAFMKEIAG